MIILNLVNCKATDSGKAIGKECLCLRGWLRCKAVFPLAKDSAITPVTAIRDSHYWTCLGHPGDAIQNEMILYQCCIHRDLYGCITQGGQGKNVDLVSDRISIETLPSFQIATAGDCDNMVMFSRLCKYYLTVAGIVALLPITDLYYGDNRSKIGQFRNGKNIFCFLKCASLERLSS